MRIAIAVFTTLSILLLPIPAEAAAPKAGATCSKINQTKNISGIKLTCLKSGKKLKWKNIGAVSTPTPTPVTSASATPTVAGYTMEQVKANNTSSKCWSAINGQVYDLTTWISSHPGGASAITSLCGTDGTSAYVNQHKGQSQPASNLASYLLGPLNK